jgi:hypothetical protein
MEVIGMSGLMVAAILLAGAALGFLFGRRTSAVRARARELEAELERLRKEHELAQAEIRAGGGSRAREAEIRQARRQARRASRASDSTAARWRITPSAPQASRLTFQYWAIYNQPEARSSSVRGSRSPRSLGLDALPGSEAPTPSRTEGRPPGLQRVPTREGLPPGSRDRGARRRSSRRAPSLPWSRPPAPLRFPHGSGGSRASRRGRVSRSLAGGATSPRAPILHPCL